MSASPELGHQIAVRRGPSIRKLNRIVLCFFDKSGAGPVSPGRDSNLSGKVAVVTGAARGIGRVIAVELPANGADVVPLDIAGPVSPASNAAPATPAELDETVRQITAYGRRSQAVRADIRDIAALPRVADMVE